MSDDPLADASTSRVLGEARRKGATFPEGSQAAVVAMGCFWGAERRFAQREGTLSAMSGYVGGTLTHPSYEDVCDGRGGHAEAVAVIFDPTKVSYEELLAVFWEGHDPTQGMRQGNDVGIQYRSGIHVLSPTQRRVAEASRERYAAALKAAGRLAAITTEIVEADVFWLAEDYHQGYLARNPQGYCGLGGLGVSYPLAA